MSKNNQGLNEIAAFVAKVGLSLTEKIKDVYGSEVYLLNAAIDVV